MPQRSKLERRYRQEREKGFDLSSCANATLPNYKPLGDRNMTAYYEKKTVRSRMVERGFMDQSGRTYDMDGKKATLSIVEREFKKAQQNIVRREAEEQELRRRIQAHRRSILEADHRSRVLDDMKMDRQLGQEVVRIAREVSAPNLSPTRVRAARSESSMSSAVSMTSQDKREAALMRVLASTK